MRSSSPPASTGSESNKEQLNKDTKSDERGESEAGDDNPRKSVFQHLNNIPVAGRPSESPRRTSYGGRRSRRNSVDENASQLSMENFGGSQDNLHMLGRNPAKEMKTHSGRRSEISDRFIDNKELEEMEKHNREDSKEKQYVKLTPSNENSPGDNRGDKVSFADLRKQKARDHFHSSGINITYNNDNEDDQESAMPQRRSSLLQQQQKNKLKDSGNSGSAAMTSWASSKHHQESDHQPKDNQNNSSTSPGKVIIKF